VHARQRLGIELDHEAQIFGQGINFFHIENWYSVHSLIRNTLKLVGLYRRGRKNTERIQVRSILLSSPRYIAKPRMPALTCFSAAIPMAAKSVYRVRYQSL
jgi:hypothetical protein